MRKQEPLLSEQAQSSAHKLCAEQSANRISKAMEITWLIITLAGLLTSVLETVRHGFVSAKFYYLLTGVALVIFIGRRILRIRRPGIKK